VFNLSIEYQNEMVYTEKVGKYLIISFYDKLMDAPRAFRLKTELKSILTQPEVAVVMDLSHVEVIDSAGFGVLISLLKRIKFLKGTLAITGVNPAVLELFTFLNLNKVFDIRAEIDYNLSLHEQPVSVTT
jgi:anti-anti-sigma factor